MPISNYSVLAALGEKHTKSTEFQKRISRSALSPFKLFAFIVHDPTEHTDLSARISRSFDRWDYLTGKRLLFFALADPPESWIQLAKGRPYFRHFTNSETQLFLERSFETKTLNPAATASAIAHQLKIPPKDLPCLVVTPNFEDPRFLWFRTCPEKIEEQLVELGHMAERGRVSYNELREANLNLCNGRGDVTVKTNLAKALAEIISFGVATNSHDRMDRQKAITQMKSVLSELQNNLRTLRDGISEETQDEFDELNIKIAIFLQLLTNNEPPLIVPIDKDHLEKDSYDILKTAGRVFEALTTDVPHTSTFDMSPALICLAKIFEKEANLSIVHWLREKLGVSLPPFYNKHQPSVKAVYKPPAGGRMVDFNMKKAGAWHPPGIGQSEVVSTEIATQGLPPGWDNPSWVRLLQNWRVIRSKRNEAAHTDVVGLQDFQAVQSALFDLNNGNIFHKLSAMKSHFRGAV